MLETRFRLATVASLVFLSLTAEAGMQHRLDSETMAPLRGPLAADARIQLRGVPLVDGEPATLELERFEVWAEGAEIKVFGADGHVIETLPLPATRYFRGRVKGEAESLVFLASSGGSVDGLVYARDRKFAIGSRPGPKRDSLPELVVEESSLLDDFPDGTFTCELDEAEVAAVGRRPHAVTNAFGEPEAQAAPTGTQRSLLHIAVETDYELFTRADGVAANVTTFIGNLLGAASTIYERDLLTELRLSYLGIYTSASDPFNVVPATGGPTAFDALEELGTRWKTAPPTSNVRSAVAMVSGKPQMSGVAWVNQMCNPSYYYSYNGGIDPPSNLGVPDPEGGTNYVAPSSNYWPLLQFTHELGHNVGSRHTHCVSLTSSQKTQYGVTRDFVDSCRSGESGCYAGTQSVPAEKGSIMSYCHLLGGGSQTRFTFGQPNETSEVVRNNMRGYMANVTPALSAITAPASLASGASGVASVTNTGLTYSWRITNGTFSGGGTTASGASVTFQGTAHPVTLVVIGTNSNGCAVTDSRVVSLGVPNVVAPVGLTATATGTTSVNVSWQPVANATGYQIHRSAGSGVFTQVGTSSGTTFSDGTAAAGTAYLYKVRATNAGGSGPFSGTDVATTVIFADPSLTEVPVKIIHLTQLRQAANALRTLAGLAPMAGDATIAANLPMRGAHVANIRNGIAAARTSLALPPLAWSGDASAGAAVMASHLAQLRDGVR